MPKIITDAEREAKRTAEIAAEIKQRKEENTRIRNKLEEQRKEVLHEIKTDYPKGINESYLLNQGINKIIPMKCNNCNNFRIYPYQFLTKQGRMGVKGNCSFCMEDTSKITQKSLDKNKVKCKCGISYYHSDNGYYAHISTSRHQNNMKKLVNGVKYSAKELDKLCSLNNIPYYKTLDMIGAAEKLNNLGDKLKTNI
jgi:hypothetical protein